MSRTLDRSRPYGEVWGNGHEAYEQDGVLFNMAGVAIGGEPIAAEPPAPKQRKARSAEPGPVEAPAPGLGGKSDDELKVLVDIAGGEWTDRAAAIALLED